MLHANDNYFTATEMIRRHEKWLEEKRQEHIYLMISIFMPWLEQDNAER